MVNFQSYMDVELITSSGDDNLICNAARVSTGNDVAGYDESAGLINYLWREGHTSPFEHVSLTFKIHVPLFIARQIMRHRTFSYNEISGRYSKLSPVFWLPDLGRPLRNKGSGAYPELVFHDEHEESYRVAKNTIEVVTHGATEAYQRMLDAGIATEVARVVLPQNMFTSFYMTGNLKNFFDFIDKRIVDNAQEEVQEVGHRMTWHINQVTPLAVKAWKDNK